MIQFFIDGGFYMWFLLIIAIAIIVLTIKNAILISQASSNAIQQIGQRLISIPFWGCIALVLGFFAHYHGIYEAMKSIMAANDISPAIVSNGYRCALITILTGMFICIWAGIFWITLRTWWQQKIAHSA